MNTNDLGLVVLLYENLGLKLFEEGLLALQGTTFSPQQKWLTSRVRLRGKCIESGKWKKDSGNLDAKEKGRV